MTKSSVQKTTNTPNWFAQHWKTIILVISVALALFLFESSIYYFVINEKFIKYWIIIPCFTYMVCCFIKYFIKNNLYKKYVVEISNIIALGLLFLSIKIEQLKSIYINNYEILSFVIVFIGFLSLVLIKTDKVTTINMANGKIINKKLFNLFYLNTSKAHEIAMLIDNKVVKNIERENVSEHAVKSSTTLSFNQKAITSSNDISTEDLSKQRVFESFDVKETKSLMLRTIYDSIATSSKSNFSVGSLVLFENVELKQLNVDDTVMILNILQDSKFNNQENDSIEINYNKMLDKMLDDFTVDYTFCYSQDGQSEQKYLIRLPYKSDDNFENGYQHNDLQLGRLSVIGIYRGEIDFSRVESMSSKFLDMVFDSYNEQKTENAQSHQMKLSNATKINNDIEFDFSRKKFDDKIRLIDIIAIIQEISFKKDEE
ncbi:MAG: hypothetical protein IKM66_00415 [Clostridia bacterium]|nr:hypothetical protein [Clostridia bacterium]